MTIDMAFEAREEIIRREEREAGRLEGITEGLSQDLSQATITDIGKSVVMLKDFNIPKENAFDSLGRQYPDFLDIIISKIEEVY